MGTKNKNPFSDNFDIVFFVIKSWLDNRIKTNAATI